MNTSTISVEPIDVSASAAVKEVNHLLALEKLPKNACISVGALYRLNGATKRQAEMLAENLLRDIVVEESFFADKEKDAAHVFVDVWYKPGVTDVVGQSVQKAATDLNAKLESVGTGKRYIFKKDKALDKKTLTAFAAKTLFNPLVQECIVTL